mmetsp:Transcript_22457/g.55564  ORF Transcript_22457/g.55564 Transcript_22457/m.55564 type:complete len:81 (-) Transcript_22457:455-697(-)
MDVVSKDVYLCEMLSGLSEVDIVRGRNWFLNQLKVGVKDVPWYWMYFVTSLNVSLQVKCYKQRPVGDVEGGQGCDAKLMS